MDLHHIAPFGNLVACGLKQTQLDSWGNVRLAERQREVLNAVRALGAATAPDIANYLGRPDSWIRPRCTELEKAGLLTPLPVPRVWARTGKQQTVYTIAEASQ